MARLDGEVMSGTQSSVAIGQVRIWRPYFEVSTSLFRDSVQYDVLISSTPNRPPGEGPTYRKISIQSSQSQHARTKRE